MCRIAEEWHIPEKEKRAAAMKTSDEKTKGVVKGAPSGFIISLMIHAGAFLLAGMLVVFTVVNKKEQKFAPPKPVDRPKMKLKKPKVKVKKNAKPRSTTRIVTKITKADMPDIQLPELGGMGTGLSGGSGLGGFDMMPDLEKVNLFGNTQSVGNDFVGTFYDFNRDRAGKPTALAPDNMFEMVRKFMLSGWKPSVFSNVYRAPMKLYTTHFCIPTDHSTLGPAAFGQPETSSWSWLVHYKGQLVYPEDIKIRFWGQGDDYMIVRVDGKVKLIACWPTSAEPYYTSIWQSSSADSRKYALGNNLSVVGDWIELKAGVPKEMEVLIGEGSGGLFEALLTVEVDGEDYPKNPFWGGPKLPIFKTEELTRDTRETIENMLYEGDASLTGGPIFRDFIITNAVSKKTETQESAVEEPAPVQDDPMRVWTSLDGKTVEAEFLTRMGSDVVVKTRKNKQIKLPFARLSKEDRVYVELLNPPKFKIDFTKSSQQITPPPESPYVGLHFPIRLLDYTFGTQLRQIGSDRYNHELNIEYFAVGEEIDGDNYVLLDHQEARFTPTKENAGKFKFQGDPVRLKAWAIWEDYSPMRGVKYGGFLIIIKDERGRVVQYKASHEFLYKNISNLRKIPIGKHFNKECNRVGPPRPTVDDRNPWSFNRT